MFLQRLNGLIASHGITKNRFLMELGLNRNAFNNWEYRGTVPSGDTLAKIADYFGVTVDYLLGRTDEKIEILKPTQDTVKRIFNLLDQAGIEQKKFAVLVGTTDKTVSAWRTGRSKSYSKYLLKIAEVLNTSVEYLLTGKESSQVPRNAVIRMTGRHNISEDALDIAFAYDDASPELQAAVRRVLGID